MTNVTRDVLAVRCRGVTKKYEAGTSGVIALRGIDLDIRKGELMIIVGPSGCGKTTLISIIAAILEQDDGICEVLGNDVKYMGAREKLHFRGRSIGFVFQNFNLIPGLTALENVSIPLLLNGMQRRKAEHKARTVLETVDLGDKVDSLPLKLSGGQQQRIAIARAVVHDPGLIICDEPTSNLDHKTGYHMINILRDLGKRPERTVIIVTHDTRILDLADRVAELDDGKILNIVSAKNAGSSP